VRNMLVAPRITIRFRARSLRFTSIREHGLRSRNRSRLGWVRARCVGQLHGGYTGPDGGDRRLLAPSFQRPERPRAVGIVVFLPRPPGAGRESVASLTASRTCCSRGSGTSCHNRTLHNRDPQTGTRTSIPVPLFFFPPEAWSPQGADEWSILTFPQALPEGDNACH
jgi:hypothetical protein